MCYFSATADNSRRARLGETLVVSDSPHGFTRWITAPSEPNTAVCIPPTAKLGVETFPTIVREARFELDPDVDEQFADSLVFLDGKRERIHLYRLRTGITLTPLWLPDEEEDETQDMPITSFGLDPMVQDEEMVLVGAD